MYHENILSAILLLQNIDSEAKTENVINMCFVINN